jgi:hypothetical protein
MTNAIWITDGISLSVYADGGTLYKSKPETLDPSDWYAAEIATYEPTEWLANGEEDPASYVVRVDGILSGTLQIREET